MRGRRRAGQPRSARLESQAAAAAAAREQRRDRVWPSSTTSSRRSAAELDELARQRRTSLPPSRRAPGRSCAAAARPSSNSTQRQLASAGRTNWPELRQRQRRRAERVAVLEELERRHEGLSAGVKEVLAAGPRRRPTGRSARSCGLVADLLQRERRGGAADRGRPGRSGPARRRRRRARELLALPAAAAAPLRRPRGLPLARRRPRPPTAPPTLDLRRPARRAGPRRPLRRNRAPSTPPLARRLLGRTWIVEKLRHAVDAGRSRPARGLRLRHPGRRAARGRRHAVGRAAARRRPA